MSNISTWSTTAASNNATPPNGWPEGMSPSSVNDSARETHAAIRTWYENVEWRDFGHTVTRTGNTTFTIASDVTSIYVANRPIRCTDSSTLYGSIDSSSYSAPNTTVTVTLDSGNLSGSLSAVALGPTTTTKSIHQESLRGGIFATGTKMLFQQTSAPTGWTKDTTHNDKALRIVSGTASSGGTTPFSGIAAASTGSHVLTIDEIPAHTHTFRDPLGGSGTDAQGGIPSTKTSDTGSTGGGQGHDHTLALDLQYVDVIIATKD